MSTHVQRGVVVKANHIFKGKIVYHLCKINKVFLYIVFLILIFK